VNEHDQRRGFEQWISQPPYERVISRWEKDRTRAWPGQYKNYEVQLAWEAWQEAQRQKAEQKEAE